MIAKKYFTFIPSKLARRFPLVLRCCDLEPSHALSTKALAAGKECRAQNGRRANIAMAVFEHACRLGLEGIVSKSLDSPYRSGPSKMWLKSKNPQCEACGASARKTGTIRDSHQTS
jgi:hypothetical protein